MQNLPLMRHRARDAIRNDPWAKTAIARLVSNAIGTGIQAHPRHPDADVRRAQKQLWDDSSSELDPNGDHDLYGLQTLAARAFFSDGEVLVRRRLRPPNAGLAVPMQIQLFEGDMLPVSKNEPIPGGEIINGVEFNEDGERVAYHLLRRHPGEYNRFAGDAVQTVRVPADEIAHVFHALRPGQVRGVPELSTVLLRLHSLDNFDDAVLFRQEVSNLFAGFIVKPQAEVGPLGDPVSGAPIDFDVDGFSPVVSLEPGAMQELAPGEDVRFATPPGAGADYAPFMRQQLMAAAASVGMPYEVLTGDLRDVSDRVLRVLLNEFRRSIEQLQQNVFIHQFCRRIWCWWVDACAAREHIRRAARLGRMHRAIRPGTHAVLSRSAVLRDGRVWRRVSVCRVREDRRETAFDQGTCDRKPERPSRHSARIRWIPYRNRADSVHGRRRQGCREKRADYLQLGRRGAAGWALLIAGHRVERRDGQLLKNSNCKRVRAPIIVAFTRRLTIVDPLAETRLRGLREDAAIR